MLTKKTTDIISTHICGTSNEATIEQRAVSNVPLPNEGHFFLPQTSLNNKDIRFLDVLDTLGFTPENCVISGSVGCICYGLEYSNTDVDVTTTMEKFNQLLNDGLIHKQYDNGKKVFYTDATGHIDVCVSGTKTSYSTKSWEWSQENSMIMNINGTDYRIANLEYLLHIYNLCMEFYPSEKHKGRVEWLNAKVSMCEKLNINPYSYKANEL